MCTGTETEPVAPGEGANDEAVNAHAQQLPRYHVRVARTKSILLQMISISHAHVIAEHHLHTPHDMRRELTDTFERPSLSNKLHLQTRLLNLKMESGSSVDNYFKEIQDLTERLAALSAPVEADFQVALVLRGLPSEYDTLRVAFVTKGAVTMSELRKALRTEERRVNPNCESVGASSGTYALNEVQATHKLQLIHSDVCGPMPVASLGGSRYFVTFTDDYTRCSQVYLLKQKTEVLNKFKEFESEVTNHAGLKIMALRTDNGGDTSHEFEAYLKMKGIRHELIVPYSSQQNILLND